MSDFLSGRSADTGIFYEVDDLSNILKTVHDLDRIMSNCSCALRLFFFFFNISPTLL